MTDGPNPNYDDAVGWARIICKQLTLNGVTPPDDFEGELGETIRFIRDSAFNEGRRAARSQIEERSDEDLPHDGCRHDTQKRTPPPRPGMLSRSLAQRENLNRKA